MERSLLLLEAEGTAADDDFPLVQRVALYCTLACNLTCHHCYIEGSPAAHRPTSAERRRVIGVLAELGKPVDLTGGEPFMMRELDVLAAQLADAGVVIGSVFTNGTLLRRRPQTLRRLIDLAGGELRWYVSLDGDEHAHDRLRGAGSYQEALAGADLLVGLGQPVFVNTMLHSGVSRDSLSDLHETIELHGFRRWRIDAPFAVGAWSGNRMALELTRDAGIALIAHAVSCWARAGLPYELEAGHILKYLDGVLYFLDNYSLSDPVCPCRIFPIWPNGDVTWCQDLSERAFVLGNLHQDPLRDIYTKYAKYKTRTITQLATANGVCSGCALLEWCGTGCRVKAIGNGDAEGADPDACHLYSTRAYQPVIDALRQQLAAATTLRGRGQ